MDLYINPQIYTNQKIPRSDTTAPTDESELTVLSVDTFETSATVLSSKNFKQISSNNYISQQKIQQQLQIQKNYKYSNYNYNNSYRYISIQRETYN